MFIEIKKMHGRMAGMSKISDTTVLAVTVFLFLLLAMMPLFNVVAEAVQQEQIERLDTTIENKDYSVLLSSLFGMVGRTVPDDAYNYIRDVDEYRFRVARAVEENHELVQALAAIIQDYPKQLADGYRDEIIEIKKNIRKHKTIILPYLESDAALSSIVQERYELYTSIVDRLLAPVQQEYSFAELQEIRKESSVLRREITVLYSRAKNVLRQ